MTEIQRENKKLNIIVLTDFSEYGDVAVRHGGILSAIFKASLTVIPLKDRLTQELFSDTFKEILQNFAENKIATTLLPESVQLSKLYQYAEETNTIMFVIGVSRNKRDTFFSTKKAVRFIKHSRVPVMTVGNVMPRGDVYQHVMLPLDIDRQSKEKALWAGYFSRFYCAVVHVLYSNFKDAFLRKKIKDNLDFVEKLYRNLEIKYQLHDFTPAIDNMDKYSLEYSSGIHASLTVIMMTKYYSFVDILLGPKEYKIIGNPVGFPVLCINERDDLYVLCT